MKRLLDSLFRKTRGGSFAVTYWDRTERTYGEGPPSFHLYLKDQRIVWRIFRDPLLGFGEGYMDGRIDFEGDFDEAFRLAHLNKEIFTGRTGLILKQLRLWSRPTGLKKQANDVQHHYDLGNDFFSLFLDESMTYSCAYFRSRSSSLEEAQRDKVDHILRKLHLGPGQSLLDIGCGWGRLIERAAQRYGVRAVGITLSNEQHAKVQERIAREGLEGQVEVRLADYREIAASGEGYDRVVSVGMFEHVGSANYPLYMQAVNRLLKPGGISLLHTITQPREAGLNSWLNKYIFPGGEIPSLRRIAHLLPEEGFHLVDVESLRLHYAMTLDRWADRFENHVETVEAMYDPRFVRMWRLYLRSCAASFRYSGLDLHQILFTKGLNNELPLTREHVYADPVAKGEVG